jgi:hypothetical protein
MNTDVKLCEHLRGLDAGSSIEFEEIFDWNDGAVTAVLRCEDCGAMALAVMIDMSDSGTTRVYWAAGLREADLRLYVRNTRSGSCDAQRHEQETDAFFACAGPAERLIAIDLEGACIVSACAFPADISAPTASWFDRVSDGVDTNWFERAGLDKGRLR